MELWNKILELPEWKWRKYRIAYLIGVVLFVVAFVSLKHLVNQDNVAKIVQELEMLTVEEAYGASGLVKFSVDGNNISVNDSNLLSLPDDYIQFYPNDDLFYYEVQTFIRKPEFKAGPSGTSRSIHLEKKIVTSFKAGDVTVDSSDAITHWHQLNHDSAWDGTHDNGKSWHAGWMTVPELQSLTIIGEIRNGAISSGSPFLITNCDSDCYVSEFESSRTSEIIITYFLLTCSLLSLIFPLRGLARNKSSQSQGLVIFIPALILPFGIVTGLLAYPSILQGYLIFSVAILALLLIHSLKHGKQQ